MDPLTLRTSRLLLRDWRDEDLPLFAAMNADSQVMEFFPRLLDRTESDALAARIRSQFARSGFGLWAVEVCGVAPFIGFVGLSVPSFEAHFTPCVEIGWRLARESWGRGYATEAARAALDVGFDRLELEEIVSFTVPANRRSRSVMERIGMMHSPDDDFENPRILQGHPLRHHVLYRKARLPRSNLGRSRRNQSTPLPNHGEHPWDLVPAAESFCGSSVRLF
jgi:RimJ/RimL family protein N-acetyltransferase